MIGITFLFGHIKFEEENPNSDFSLPGKTFGHFILDANKLNREIDIQTIINKAKLLSPSYLDELGSMIEKYDAGIIVRKNDELIYKSPLLFGFDEENHLNAFLEPFQRKKLPKSDVTYGTLIQKDFYYSDAEVSIFIVVNWKAVYDKESSSRNLITGLMVIFFIISTVIITMFIYRDINRSIYQLKNAVHEIKKGNLDFKITKNLNDELGELSDAFDQMRIKLKESNILKEKYEENRKNLISNISHDLKTPMMSIKGYIQGIKDGVADTPEKINKYIDTIYEKAKTMEVLINELFLFSRLDLQKEEFHFQKIDIIDFLEDCVEDLDFDLKKIGGAIFFHHDIEHAYVNADIQKLKRVVLNIIDNAVKYQSEQPIRIHICAMQNDDKIIIEIQDNGRGISKEHLPFIFNRFYRGDPSRNTQISGTGLGLAISKQIIEQHGGEMWVESIEHQGTRLFFSLRM
jgi:histidine kinase